MTEIPPVAGDHLESSPSPATPADVHAFPKAGGSKSFWLDSVSGDPLLTHRSTDELPKEVDVAIIGSGMTGVLCAHSLLTSSSPPASILMLEAREFCSGATGRNAGHCKPDQWRGFAKYSKAFGPEQAIKILRNERETWRRLVQFVQRENVDCDLWTGKTMDVITTDELAEEASKLLEKYRAAGGDVDHLTVIRDPAEAESRSGVSDARMIISWDASTLSPWKLVAYIARKCLESGLNLQTRTPVTMISSQRDAEGGWRLHTPRGDVLAKTVVHATNAYAPALLGEMREIIKPTPHMCNAVVPPPRPHSAPITASSSSTGNAQGLKSSYSVMYPHGIHTINPRIGSDGTHLISAAPNNPALTAYLAEDATRLTDDGLANYPPIDEVVTGFTEAAFGWTSSGELAARYLYSWSGIIGRVSLAPTQDATKTKTGDMVPLVGAVPDKPGQWICAGHNAHGMSRIFTAAPGLASLIQGGKWADTGLPECFEITPERLTRLQRSAVGAQGPKKAYHPLR